MLQLSLTPDNTARRWSSAKKRVLTLYCATGHNLYIYIYIYIYIYKQTHSGVYLKSSQYTYSISVLVYAGFARELDIYIYIYIYIQTEREREREGEINYKEVAQVTTEAKKSQDLESANWDAEEPMM